MNAQFFMELTAIVGITLIIATIMRILKQPLMIGYIFSGIILGPFGLNLVKSADTISSFAQIGIVFLLFMVGLNLNPKIIKQVGKVALITGVGQVVFTAGIGFFICKLLGFTNIISFFISISITFSSTIIIMKLLSDKRDLDTLYGRISVGFLIVQDIIAILILLVVSSLGEGMDIQTLIFGSFLKLSAVIIFIYLISKYILPKVTKSIAKSQEYLLLFSIAWCFFVAALFEFINFSVEAGALLAGIALSVVPYHYEISSKMKPLRDFFIVLFFILLGSNMVFSDIGDFIIPSIVISLFILIGNPLVVMVLMGVLGYKKRTGFKAGLTVAQISEFGLIVITLGITTGFVNEQILSLVAFVGIITIAGSTYMILYSEKLYLFLSKYLSIFEKKGLKVDEHKYSKNKNHEIIMFGKNRIGHDILKTLEKMKKKFLIVDYNPDTVLHLAKRGYDCKYGDANDYELLNEINFEKAKMIISTVPDIETNSLIISKAKEENKNSIITVVSHQIDEAIELYEMGATYVIMPHFLGGEFFSTLIQKNKLSANKFLKERVKHIKHLYERKSIGHEHPVQN